MEEKQTQLSFFDDEIRTNYDEFDVFTIQEFDVKYGDIFQLGRHRLMCGDSTKKEDVEKLMNGAVVDMVFTDPPYNVGFNGRSGNFEVIMNDNMTDENFNIFIDTVILNMNSLNPKAWYIWCNWKFYGLLQNKLDYKACIVWAKNNFGMGNGYRHQHEFCLFGGYIKETINNETDLWYHDKDIKYVHPTQKPVSLSVRAIENSSNKNDIVLDLFGGSGSTLIGCELTNRICYMMELDPQYIQVIISRYEYTTGRKAIKL